MDGPYVVLVDLVRSRDIADREVFESRLERALAHVNEAERTHLSTPLSRMKGIDEFGCVLTELAPLPDVLTGLLDRIHPMLGRFGVAAGEIDVGASRATVATMDGPAFHRASELLTTAEERDLFVGVDTGSPVDGLLASALNLLVLSRRGLTERQVEVILAYEEHGTQDEAADALGLSQQSVSKSLGRAGYASRTQIRAELRAALEAVYD